MHWRRSTHGGLEEDMAFNGDWAGWELPFTHTSQLTVDWRRTWRSMGTGRAGSCHGGGAAKAWWTGERRGKHTGRGALGLSIHWWLSKLCGLGAVVVVSNPIPPFSAKYLF